MKMMRKEMTKRKTMKTQRRMKNLRKRLKRTWMKRKPKVN